MLVLIFYTLVTCANYMVSYFKSLCMFYYRLIHSQGKFTVITTAYVKYTSS